MREPMTGAVHSFEITPDADGPLGSSLRMLRASSYRSQATGI
jgi:hypothetical protein